MNGFFSFVKKLVDGFENEGVDYAFTGALAASFYGVPRTTADVDIMVDFSSKDFHTKLVSSLQFAGLEIDEKQLDDALTSGYKIATFRCKTSPYKVDIIFSNVVKKRPGTIGNVKTYFQQPEDLVLAKLRMIKVTVPPERAIKDEEDVRAILRFSEVDIEAIKKQAKKDKTFEIWKRFSGG